MPDTYLVRITPRALADLEAIFDYIQLAHTVAGPDSVAALNPPAAGQAIVPPPSAVTATGKFFRVETREGTLRLRSAPKVSSPPQANVIGNLPDGHVVNAEGVVRWTRAATEDAPPGMGVAFAHISAESVQHIAGFCASRPPLYFDD